MLTVALVLAVSGHLADAVQPTEFAPAPTSQLDSLKKRFDEASWKTQIRHTSFHAILTVSDGSRTWYMFRFQNWHDGLRRNPTSDPNLLSFHFVGPEPISVFFEESDWPEMAKFAVELGFSSETVQEYRVEAAKTAGLDMTKHRGENRPALMRTSDAQAVVAELRREGHVQRLIGDSTGERIEDLPYDTEVRKAVVLRDTAWLQLTSESNPLHTKYPVICRLTERGLSVIFEHANDIRGLPFHPAFPEIVSIFMEHKDLGDWWNYYEESQGQAGLWFRSQLASSGDFGVWSPTEAWEVIRKLDQVSPLQKGLVYARSGGRAVAQFYDTRDQLMFVEFLDDEIIAIRDLEAATATIEKTGTRSLWWAYNGVSRQFGHPAVIQALHRSKNVGGVSPP